MSQPGQHAVHIVRWRPIVILAIGVALTVLLLVGMPLVALLMRAFSDGGGIVANVENLVDDAAPFRNSLVVAAATTAISVVLGTSLSWITTRTNTPGRRLLGQLCVVPFYLSPLLGAVGWVVLGSERAGFLNRAASSVGLGESPINIFGALGIIWVMSLYYTPIAYLLASGAFRSMDPSLEESSQVLGASTLRTAINVTVPLIRPAVLGSTLLIFVLALGQFDVPAVLGMPVGYMVVTTRIYQEVSGFVPAYGVAATMSLVLLAIAGLGVWAQLRSLGQRRFATVTGRGFRPRVIDVRWLRWPLFSIAWLYVVCSVILPLGAIAYASFVPYLGGSFSWDQLTWTNYTFVWQELPATRIALRNTVLLALIGATLVLMLSGLAAWLVARVRLRFVKALEFLTMVPVALPGTAFALGLLWAWIELPFGIYGTIWLLLICYVTLFLPFGFRAVSATLAQIDLSLEEAARLCGAGSFRLFRTVTAPLLLPGLIAGWTLVMILIVRELSASVLLYDSNSIVLSVAIYDLWVNSSLGLVAALAMIQGLLLFSILALLSRIGNRVSGGLA